MAHREPELEVRLERLSLRRGGRRVLSGVSWRIRRGEHWVLLGDNGSGKTQLIKLLAGLVWPAPARRPTLEWWLDGERHDTARDVKSHIAYLGAERQDKYERYDWNMTVEALVGTGIHGSDIPLAELARAERLRVRKALTTLAALPLAPRSLLSLSYGERRVALIARALAARPSLLLLDEVCNGLDEENRRRVARWLERSRSPRPWVLATHRAEDVPASATHLLVLREGRVTYRGRCQPGLLGKWLPAARPAARLPRSARRTAARDAVPLVRLTRASVYLNGRAVLRGISMSVHRGDFWVIHGHNGSGKTTLLRTLYGDHGVAVGGQVQRAGIALGVPLESFRRRAGLVAPHLQAQYPRALTVAAVVQSGNQASIGLQRQPSTGERHAAQRALRLLDITRLARRTLAELSYGQSRRVLFARALVRNPPLLLLDEPFAGLDPATHRDLAALISSLATRGVTVVVTAHGPRPWRALATHELELAGGRVRSRRVVSA
jgi:molybdate transport system ATP-binding protein